MPSPLTCRNPDGSFSLIDLLWKTGKKTGNACGGRGLSLGLEEEDGHARAQSQEVGGDLGEQAVQLN